VKIPPFLIGTFVALLASGALYYLGITPEPLASDRATVFGTLAQVAGTMLGFMLAALAVVASITDTELLKRMRATGHYNALLQNLFTGAALFLGCAILSLLALLGVPLPAWTMSTLFGLQIAALIFLFIVGWQFWLTLRNVNPISKIQPEMPKLD